MLSPPQFDKLAQMEPVTEITFFDVTEEAHLPLRKALRAHPAWEARLVTDALQEQNAVLAEGSKVISTFGTSRVTAGVLDKLPSLRLIATRSTGHDHIDLESAAARGISVCNVPGYSEDTVAEYTLGLLIALMLLLLRNLE